MTQTLFTTFAPMLRQMSRAELEAEIIRPQKLLLASGQDGHKQLEIAFAPFDYINKDADIVIVGLTPGRQQMRNALLEAQRCLKSGQNEEDAKKAAKNFASFSGPMRSNLVAMLDNTGMNKALNLASTGSLWAQDSARVHFTSALRYPVFVGGENYSGAPSMLATPLLKGQLMNWFADEMRAMPHAVFIPLGPKVTAAVEAVAIHVGFNTARILSGLPHSSGANAERIAYFLGNKPREQLSTKTNAASLDATRQRLLAQVAALAF